MCECLSERWKEVLESTLKELKSEEYQHFFKFPGNILLPLNFDGFQPFTHTQYTVAAIHFLVLNLPSEEMYKIYNIVLVGIIPGPKEPRMTLNSYLAPFIQELTHAYHGWKIATKHIITLLKTLSAQACIGCVTCDTPATRKICGFLSHTARLGCS